MSIYNPKDFTLTEYQHLLELTKQKFSFKKFTEFKGLDSFVLWRHDIDFSLEQALKIAEIEFQHQVQSTYFIHLHNDFYNALDANSLRIIQKIYKMGHSLGLHFDIHYYKIASFIDLEYWLAFEKNILETLFDVPIEVFSFHNTTEYSMSFDAECYAGMINTYSDFFKKNILYCSDSNGYWRHRSLLSMLQDSTISKLQVLLHPCWWTEKEMQPREKILWCANKKQQLSMATYDDLLQNFGRVNLK